MCPSFPERLECASPRDEMIQHGVDRCLLLWTGLEDTEVFEVGSINSSLVTCLSQPLSQNARLQEPTERGADAEKRGDPEHRHDDRQSQTARSHQDVEEQNVSDNRSEQRQRERDVAIDQEQDRRDDFEQEYDDQIVGDKERPDELASRSGRRRAGNEMEEAVQSEDEKDESKKETGDDSNYFHVSLFV